MSSLPPTYKCGANHVQEKEMPDFFQTRMGHIFFEGTMPTIARSIKVIADHIEAEKTKKSKEKENVVHLLENMIDGKPNDGIGTVLTEVLEYVEKT